MSWWAKLFRRRVATAPAPPPPPPAPVAPSAAESPPQVAEAEAWLAALVEQAAAGDADPAALGGTDARARVETLVADGHTRLAAEWLDKLVAVAPPGEARDELRLRAVAIRDDRGELRDALPHLHALAESPAHGARAHFLLGEHHRREGDLGQALRHFEAVLALDVEYPNARVRVQALRAARGAAAAAPAAMDETIAGPEGRGAAAGARYRLLRELGRGATGAVYLARDVELEREVALKLLHPHLYAAAQASARARFFEEARLTAALRHPGIIAILDLDEVEKRIVMEHAAGGTLRDRLRAGPMAPPEALLGHVEVLSALLATHRRGVVHRDLKPANLLYRRPPPAELVLCDFGVAHLAPAATDSTPVVAGARRDDREAVGTLGYMAPEQRRGEDVDPRADLYAAAVILFECLAGAPPWERDPARRGVRVTAELQPTPKLEAALGPELLAPVSAHILALGAADARDRPSTAEALAAARALHDRAVAAAEYRELARDLEDVRRAARE